MSADLLPPHVDRPAQFRRRLIILVLLVLIILLLARFLTAAEAPPPPSPVLITATHTASPTATFTPFPTDLFTPVVTFSAIPPTFLPQTRTATPGLTPTAAGSATPTPMPPPSTTVSAKACQGFGQDEGMVWVVAGCDTLAHISHATGISLLRLLAANPDIHDPDLIYPGQIIRLPGR
jgi:LysM domain